MYEALKAILKVSSISKDLVDEIIDSMEHGGITSYTHSVVPRHELARIYKIRSDIQQAKKTPIEGLQVAAKRLHDDKDELVGIHGMTSSRDAFVLFTDAHDSRVIGLIISRDKGSNP